MPNLTIKENLKIWILAQNARDGIPVGPPKTLNTEKILFLPYAPTIFHSPTPRVELLAPALDGYLTGDENNIGRLWIKPGHKAIVNGIEIQF